jgi:hypothetical protein
MKKLFLTLVISLNVQAVAHYDFDSVQAIQGMNQDGDEFIIQFWGMAQVFRLPVSSRLIPCLWNSYKANMRVGLSLDKRSGVLSECTMVSWPLPGADLDDGR